MKKPMLAYMTVLVLIASPLALAQGGGGGSKGGGGGDIKQRKQTDGAQWFSLDAHNNPETIRYCLRISPKFGMTEAELIPLIETTFRAWVDYREERFESRLTEPAKKLERQAECRPETDLTIYFGIENGAVRTARKKYENPYALAERTSIGATYWGKGFMWFANPGTVHLRHVAYFPAWKEVENQLYGALLHEWGHVFGFEDGFPGTIMRENLAWLLVDPYANHSGAWLTRIDHTRELARRYDAAIELDSSVQYQAAVKLQPLLGLRFLPTRVRFSLEKFRARLEFSSGTETQVFESARVSRDLIRFTGSVFRPPIYAPASIIGQLSTRHYIGVGPATFELEYNLEQHFANLGPWVLNLIHDGEKVWISNFEGQR